MSLDPIRVAIEDIEKIRVLISDNKNLSSKFRARARSMPSLMQDVGLVPALSFCFGKTGAKVYDDIRDVWKNNKKLTAGDEDKKSYALYLFITINYFVKTGLVNSADNVVNVLKQLNGNELVASKVVHSYLLQVKRLSEAIFEEQKGE